MDKDRDKIKPRYLIYDIVQFEVIILLLQNIISNLQECINFKFVHLAYNVNTFSTLYCRIILKWLDVNTPGGYIASIKK